MGEGTSLTNHVESVQCTLHVALYVLSNRHVLDLIDQGNDALECIFTVVHILLRPESNQGVELPIGKRLGTVVFHAVGKRWNPKQGQKLVTEGYEGVSKV